jgi:hypothetical protein
VVQAFVLAAPQPPLQLRAVVFQPLGGTIVARVGAGGGDGRLRGADDGLEGHVKELGGGLFNVARLAEVDVHPGDAEGLLPRRVDLTVDVGGEDKEQEEEEQEEEGAG